MEFYGSQVLGLVFNTTVNTLSLMLGSRSLKVTNWDKAIFEGRISESDKYTRSFPTNTLVTAVSLRRPLIVYPLTEDYRKFSAQVVFRNGVVHEIARVKRLPSGGIGKATLVVASYLDGKRGQVYKSISRYFPEELLKDDAERQRMSQVEWLTVSD